jgi:acyl-CoA thioesterase
MGYLEEIKRCGRDANPFFVLMGINIVSYGKGNAELSMDIRPDMMNGAGWMQGGLYTALADEAMALALFATLGENARIATISETTSYFKGVKTGRISARSRVMKRGRSVAFVEAEVYAGEDLLSKTSASFAISS